MDVSMSSGSSDGWDEPGPSGFDSGTIARRTGMSGSAMRNTKNGARQPICARNPDRRMNSVATVPTMAAW
jgi:hypothetical protein